MPSKKPLSIKDLLAIPLLLLLAVLVIPTRALIRKLAGKASSTKSLTLSQEEMILLEHASKNGIPVLVNGKKTLLQPFDVAHDHIHSSCGTCPDELHLDDMNGKPCLSASRDTDSTSWSLHAMQPVLFGILGHVDSDLHTLTISEQSLGNSVYTSTEHSS